MNVPIRMPFLERRAGNLHEQRQGLSNGSNTFLARSFVYINGSNELQACATAATACYGWAPGPSVSPTAQPPEKLYDLVYPFHPVGSQFVVNLSNNAGDVGNSTAPTLSAIAVAGQYGLKVLAGGALAGRQCLNVEDTTTKFFKVVGIYPNQSSTDKNPLVLVELIAAVIQA